MATVIERERSGDSSVSSTTAGWLTALAVLVVLGLIALFVWPGYASQPTAPAYTSTTNSTLPSADTTGTGGNATSPTGGTPTTQGTIPAPAY